MSKILISLFIASFLLCPGGGFAAQGKNAATPWNDAGSQYSANVKTGKYHKPGCKFYDCRDCTKFFRSSAAAKKAGYVPCKVCGG